MKRTPNPCCAGHEEDSPLRKVLRLGVIACTVAGLSIVTWQSSKQTLPISENKNSEAPGIERSGTASRVNPRELTSAARQHQEKKFARLRAAFLAGSGITDPIEKEAALKQSVEGLSPEMAAALLASLNRDELKCDAAQRLFELWATAKPSEAAVWAQGLADLATLTAFVKLAALRWASFDLSNSVAWARALPDGELRTEIIAAIGFEAVRSATPVALNLAAELPAGQAQADLILRATAEWAYTDQHGVMQWAQQIKDSDLRLLATEQIAVASAEKDPIGAANIALQQMSPGAEQDRALVCIVQRFVQTDPVAASAWVSGFPANALGRDAIDNLVNIWAHRDLVASGNWLSSLPSGGLRNAGVLAYSRVLAQTDPASAQRWASSVSVLE